MNELDPTFISHEGVYRALRVSIMHGELEPGQSVTIRGLASKFGVSMTPARDAIRRLSAEGALSISSTGRVATPELSNDRIEELASIRALLEPELASRALPRAHLNLLERLSNINSLIDQAIVKDDAVDYIRRNLEFHRTLYLRAQAPAMLALVETVWLQLGPTMRSLYSQLQRREASHNHRLAIAALKVGDEPSLKLAIRADVTQGLRMLASD
ncbi:GntR family transcriptional regulator [Amylibacter sp.]|jgi:DNA-binding GntR family transcriptional regulator|nr:GntR family transcriptional regulator [Amylibacter sp.]MDA8913522.1 GntR family transcriptional regulator [Amylibacter sp.]MDA9229502.1 GntR family transcriptional regulator [Amylibacter sp.]MDA9243709.1 GntR family transcriptional regulator [Amylibacter sp.]MDA9290580.1 GntR family transcriptional regulator [Amylibacter sp.]|tara:strand:- start:170 stop:811 length:642 start_codon:yes stop_codon:yes gene_type:complete